MNVDKANLKALAEASGLDQWYSAGDLRYCDDKTGEIHGLHHDDSRFIAAASPATILALLAEIERLKRALQEEEGRSNMSSRAHRVVSHKRESVERERDQLKAESEALRRDAKRYRFLRNQHWPVAELAVVCNPKVSVKLGHDCPSGDRLDQQVDGAMIRGASHD